MKHNNIEVRKFECLLPFMYWDNLQAVNELMELMDKITKYPLVTVYDYVKMYDRNLYTYETWEELVESEKECTDGLTEKECNGQINISIWRLPCGWYVQYV